MVQHSSDEYGAFGSVPYDPSVAPSGLNAPNMGERATPENMGSAIGQGISKVGETAQEESIKYANMAMETAQNTAEVNFIKDAGDLKAKYMQFEGNAAVNARPQYEAEMEALQQKHAQGLPLIALHGYNINTIRSLRFSTSDYASYAAGQAKDALMDSGRKQIDIGKMMAADPSVAIDDRRFGEQVLAPIVHGHQTQLDLDNPGLKTNEDGIVSFDESKPEGQNLKAQFENNLNHHMGLAWETRFDTLAKTIGPISAYDKFQQDKGEIPNPDSVVRLEASLQPQAMRAQANNDVNTVMTEAAQEHRQLLLNPPLSVRNNNPGNLRDSSTGQFRIFSTPEEGAKAMQEDLSAKISGNSPAMEKNFGKGYSPTLSNIITTYAPAIENNPADYIKTVSKETGFAPNQVLTADDIPKLQAAMTKVEAGGSSATSTQNQKSYATNPDGSPLSVADYASTHRQYLLDRADEIAEANMPGSLKYKNMMRQITTAQIDAAISDQKAQFAQNNNQIMRAYNGELTQGKKPMSLDELEAIPGIRDNLNYSNVHTPDFIRSLEVRLNSRAGGENADAKHYGVGAMQAFKDLSNGTIKDDHDIQQRFINGDLTAAGMKWMQEQLKSNQDPEGAADGKMLSAVLEAGKYRMNDDKEAWPSGMVAMTKMDNELKQKGILASDRYDGIDNKNSILHALDPLISAKETPQAIADALSKIDEAKPGFVGAVIEGPYRWEKRQLINDFQSGKYTTDKAAGEKAIKTAYLNGNINDDDAMNLAIAYGYAIPKKAP